MYFYEPSNTRHRKTTGYVFEIQFACELLKLVSGSKPGYAPRNAENSLSVTFGFTVAYAHEVINILVYVLDSIVFLFYDVNLDMEDFVNVEFDSCQLALR